MQNEDGWEKGIQMDVKGVSPLDVVTTPGRRGYQIFVRHKPENRSHDYARGDGVDEHDPENEFDAGHDSDLRHHRKNDRGKHEKDA